MEQAAVSPQLDYAPAAPVHRRRRWRRFIALTLLVGAAVAGGKFGPGYFKQAQYLYWQSRCMRFSAAPDWVAYEEDPARSAGLAKKPGYQPACLNGPWTIGGQPAVGFVPAELKKFSPTNACAVFVGARTSPAGERRLVVAAVLMQFLEPSGRRVLGLCGAGMTPATFRPGSKLGGFRGGALDVRLEPADRLRLFWGQPDPQQADHFTVAYVFNGKPGVIDGWLRDNGQVRWGDRSLGGLPVWDHDP